MKRGVALETLRVDNSPVLDEVFESFKLPRLLFGSQEVQYRPPYSLGFHLAVLADPVRVIRAHPVDVLDTRRIDVHAASPHEDTNHVQRLP